MLLAATEETSYAGRFVKTKNDGHKNSHDDQTVCSVCTPGRWIEQNDDSLVCDEHLCTCAHWHADKHTRTNNNYEIICCCCVMENLTKYHSHTRNRSQKKVVATRRRRVSNSRTLTHHRNENSSSDDVTPFILFTFGQTNSKPNIIECEWCVSASFCIPVSDKKNDLFHFADCTRDDGSPHVLHPTKVDERWPIPFVRVAVKRGIWILLPSVHTPFDVHSTKASVNIHPVKVIKISIKDE